MGGFLCNFMDMWVKSAVWWFCTSFCERNQLLPQDHVFFFALKHGTRRSRPSSQNHQQHRNQHDEHNGMTVCNLF
ncbi:hypothetical protein CY35_12G091400 [Sphagnum magellanicum]|nr:hypothetical protein CY35_12G091400 [Sphagnum magellanicum]KAH9546354.1 hypothetical protein CY35_12G091400 [Sphagnum magellanicum]KAH9546355.1 hypothetical protein CY35_12G091400 [Sphagnum magellanicum]KAH9546356.1 hypothetical protein CY35_12G091400 [Sphagnum magellanicum]KAH9546357.1 hypothetical protein CY35_12G091400 [Sphagnum magellanicum]